MLYRTLVLSLTLLAVPSFAESRIADAAMQGDVAGIKRLLAQGVDPTDSQGDGMTALHWAAYRGDANLVRLLLRAGVNLHSATRNGALTPLLLAAQNGHAEAVRELLAAGAPAGSANANGTTALMLAASSGSVDTVQALLDRGAEINAKENARGQTALMFAAGRNRTDVVRLLAQRGAQLNLASRVQKLERLRVDMDGNAIAVKDDESQPGKPAFRVESPKPEGAKPETAEKKPARAGDVAMQGPREAGTTVVGGLTALLFAARDGHLDTVRALLDAGANANQVSESEKISPLVMAILNGHLDVAKLLLDRGADPNLASTAGLTALYATVDVQWAPHAWSPQPSTAEEKTSYLELIKALLTRGANPNARLTKRLWFRGLSQDPTWVDPAGATAFWRAAQSNDVAAMKLLAEAKADPNLATTTGATPLMVAAGVGWMANHSANAPDSWLPSVKLCVELGANVKAADSRGYTALHGAAYIGDNEVVNYLISKGADVKAKTKAGDTVADMANGPTRFGIPHAETVALLEKLGSENSHNCRSDMCLVAPKVEPPKADTAKPGAEKPQPAQKTGTDY